MRVLYETNDVRHRSRSAPRMIALIGLTVARTPAKQIARERRFVVYPVYSRVRTPRHDVTAILTRQKRISDWSCVESLYEWLASNASQLYTFYLNLHCAFFNRLFIVDCDKLVLQLISLDLHKMLCTKFFRNVFHSIEGWKINYQ